MISGELWIIYALVFAAVLLAFQGLYWLVVRGRRETKAINRRLALGNQLENPTEVLHMLRRERGLGFAKNVPVLGSLERLFVQTGLRMSRLGLIAWMLGIATPLYALLWLLGMGVTGLFIAGGVALAVVYLFLRLVRRRRIKRFAEQLPDALDIVVRGLRAGHPFRVALGLVARELPDPVGTEFGIVLDEITFGLDQRQAVSNLYRRVGQDDLTFLSVAITIQSETGGNLAEILTRLSHLLRQRHRIRAKIRVLTAEGRLSAVFLSATPFVLFAIITLIHPAYFGDVRNHPFILPVAALASFLLISGNIIMYRMVNFKF